MKPIKIMNKLNESIVDEDDKTVYFMSKDRNFVYRSELASTVIDGFNSYIVWDLYLLAGKEGKDWYGPEHFEEDKQYVSFLQYLVQEGLASAGEANDLLLVTSDDHIDLIEIK